MLLSPNKLENVDSRTFEVEINGIALEKVNGCSN